MGIQQDIQVYLRTLPLPKPFSVCELGDQGVCGEGKNIPAEPYYRSFGCNEYTSIDGNGKASITADLNRPLTFGREHFDLVTDFGTGEHIFDQAQVWRTLHHLTKRGGYIAFDRPCAGYEKHCYYLTHEGLYRDIAEANGYLVMALDHAQTPRGGLIRGVFRKVTGEPFKVPQQSRYRESLKI